MEATYAKKERYEFFDADIDLPISLDRPSNKLEGK